MGLASDPCGASAGIRYEIRVDVEIRVVRQISRGYLLFAVIMLLAQQGCRDSRAVRGSGEQPSTTYRGPSGGYGEYHAMPGNAKIFWDSPKIRAIEKEYDSLGDAYAKNSGLIPGDDLGDKSINVDKMFHSLLKKQLSGSELHQLAAACDTLPADVENAGFARGVLAFIVKSFADSADRESLVRLLSTRCPCSP